MWETAADNAIVLAQISTHISGFYLRIIVEACTLSVWVWVCMCVSVCVCARTHMCGFLQGKQILDILLAGVPQVVKPPGASQPVSWAHPL